MEVFEMCDFVNAITNMSSSKYTFERKKLLDMINGDMFFPIRFWPKKMVKKFFPQTANG